MAEFSTPIATVDVVLLTLMSGGLAVVLAVRERPPFAERLALPGGYIHVDRDDDTAATARRVLAAKAGLDAPHLEQLYTFSGGVRDPRGWSLSVAYYALVPAGRLDRVPGLEAVPAAPVVVVPVDALPQLPFDHGAIVKAAVDRVRSKSAYSSLPAFLLDGAFTLAELQDVYERVIGTRLDKASFRRKIEDQSLITPIPGARRGGAHRPAQLYRLSSPTLTSFSRAL